MMRRGIHPRKMTKDTPVPQEELLNTASLITHLTPTILGMVIHHEDLNSVVDHKEKKEDSEKKEYRGKRDHLV